MSFIVRIVSRPANELLETYRLRLGLAGEKALNIRVYVDRSPSGPSPVAYVNKSRKTPADLFDFMTLFCVFVRFLF